jgi:hypothetical protein
MNKKYLVTTVCPVAGSLIPTVSAQEALERSNQEAKRREIFQFAVNRTHLEH